MPDFSQDNFLKQLNMLAIQSGIVKYHCLYTLGALAFKTPGVFLNQPVETLYLKTFHNRPEVHDKNFLSRTNRTSEFV